MEFEDSSPRVIQCARYGELDELKECLMNGETLYCQDDHGNTALHMACANGIIDMVHYILEVLRNDSERLVFLNKTNENGSTALHWAALNGHDQIVKLLINAGVNVSLEDRQGKSAYYYAEQHHHEAVIDVLLTMMEQQGILYNIESLDDNEEHQNLSMTEPTPLSMDPDNEDMPQK